MAAAIPLVVTFAQAGGVAGMMSMATASVAGFLQVGGAVLGAVGALTGKKDLQKFGALMSLGAGLTNLATNAASGASSAADAAGSAATEGLKNGVQAGVDSASASVAGDWANSAIEAASQGSALAPQGGSLFESALQTAGTGAGDMATGLAGSGGLGSDPFGIASGSNGGIVGRLMQQGPGQTQGLGSSLAQPAGNTSTQTAESVLAREGSKLTLDDVLKTVGDGIKKTPEWIRKNPELSKFGFSILEGIYGPDAMAAEEQKRQMDRRLRNINTPIRLTMGGLQGG